MFSSMTYFCPQNERTMENQKTEYQEFIIGRIKELRLRNDIGQQKLSRILSVSTGQVGNIESPKFPHKYTLRQIKTFCDHINFPIERIFLTDEERASENAIGLLIDKIVEYND